MTDRANRRDDILKAASDLFMEQGYHATSVREISQVVGCTEAALYYHFKGGKRELLRQVIGVAEVDLQETTAYIQAAESLRDLILRYGQAVALLRRGRIHRTIRWMSGELHRLDAEERDTFYRPLLGLQKELERQTARFDADPVRAHEIAWLILCTSFGYRQIFYDLEVESLAYIEVTRLFNLLADSLAPA